MRSGHRSDSRRGAAMIEFALVIPIFLILVFGIVELGRVMMLNQVTTNACREACRLAIRPGMKSEKVMATCNNYLNTAGISQTGRVVAIKDGAGNVVANLSDIKSHSPVVVDIQIPYAQNTWGLTWITGSYTLRSYSAMRRE